MEFERSFGLTKSTEAGEAIKSVKDDTSETLTGVSGTNQLDNLEAQIEAALNAITLQMRKPVLRRQIIQVPGQPGRVQQVIRRLPTPQPDVIERVYVVESQQDTINLIIQKPLTPQPYSTTRTVYEPSKNSKINEQLIKVPSKNKYQPQPGYYMPYDATQQPSISQPAAAPVNSGLPAYAGSDSYSKPANYSYVQPAYPTSYQYSYPSAYISQAQQDPNLASYNPYGYYYPSAIQQQPPSQYVPISAPEVAIPPSEPTPASEGKKKSESIKGNDGYYQQMGGYSTYYPGSYYPYAHPSATIQYDQTPQVGLNSYSKSYSHSYLQPNAYAEAYPRNVYLPEQQAYTYQYPTYNPTNYAGNAYYGEGYPTVPQTQSNEKVLVKNDPIPTQGPISTNENDKNNKLPSSVSFYPQYGGYSTGYPVNIGLPKQTPEVLQSYYPGSYYPVPYQSSNSKSTGYLAEPGVQPLSIPYYYPSVAPSNSAGHAYYGYGYPSIPQSQSIQKVPIKNDPIPSPEHLISNSAQVPAANTEEQKKPESLKSNYGYYPQAVGYSTYYPGSYYPAGYPQTSIEYQQPPQQPENTGLSSYSRSVSYAKPYNYNYGQFYSNPDMYLQPQPQPQPQPQTQQQQQIIYPSIAEANNAYYNYYGYPSQGVYQYAATTQPQPALIANDDINIHSISRSFETITEKNIALAKENAYEDVLHRRNPVVRRQIIRLPAEPKQVRQIVRRAPTPVPDEIERVIVMKNKRDIVNLVIERPATPPPQIKIRTIIAKPKKPIINSKIVRVPPRSQPQQSEYSVQAPISYPYYNYPGIEQQASHTSQIKPLNSILPASILKNSDNKIDLGQAQISYPYYNYPGYVQQTSNTSQIQQLNSILPASILKNSDNKSEYSVQAPISYPYYNYPGYYMPYDATQQQSISQPAAAPVNSGLPAYAGSDSYSKPANYSYVQPAYPTSYQYSYPSAYISQAQQDPNLASYNPYGYYYPSAIQQQPPSQYVPISAPEVAIPPSEPTPASEGKKKSESIKGNDGYYQQMGGYFTGYPSYLGVSYSKPSFAPGYQFDPQQQALYPSAVSSNTAGNAYYGYGYPTAQHYPSIPTQDQVQLPVDNKSNETLKASYPYYPQYNGYSTGYPANYSIPVSGSYAYNYPQTDAQPAVQRTTSIKYPTTIIQQQPGVVPDSAGYAYYGYGYPAGPSYQNKPPSKSISSKSEATIRADYPVPQYGGYSTGYPANLGLPTYAGSGVYAQPYNYAYLQPTSISQSYPAEYTNPYVPEQQPIVAPGVTEIPASYNYGNYNYPVAPQESYISNPRPQVIPSNIQPAQVMIHDNVGDANRSIKSFVADSAESFDEKLGPEIEEAYEAFVEKSRKPVVKRQIIKVAGNPGKVRQIVRRVPTPKADVIERVFVVEPSNDIVNLIIEKPYTPQPEIKNRTIYTKPKKPVINQQVVRVPPRHPQQYGITESVAQAGYYNYDYNAGYTQPTAATYAYDANSNLLAAQPLTFDPKAVYDAYYGSRANGQLS